MANTTFVYDPNFYGYDPSTPGAIVTAVLFAVMGTVVLILNVRFKSWFLMAVPVAAYMEVVGFALRLDSSYDLGKYIVAVLCILLAPTVFAVADYGLISRIMIRTGIHHPIFTPSVARWIFLCADISSFFIQCTGGGLTASKDLGVSQNGARMLLAGLSLALSVFCFFLFLVAYVYKVMRAKAVNSSEEGRNVRAILFILFFDMILFIIRSGYRVAEYAKLEYHNPISTNEGLFYALDGFEMLLLSAMWIPFHPGFWNMVDDRVIGQEVENSNPNQIQLTVVNEQGVESSNPPKQAENEQAETDPLNN